MSDRADGQKELTARDFTLCLLAGIARGGCSSMWTPQSAPINTMDAAANAAWQYLRQHQEGSFDYRFRLYLGKLYGESDIWREALNECECDQLVKQITFDSKRWYRLEFESLQTLASTLPGSEELWDEVASVFIAYVEAEEPFALARTPLLW